MAATADSIWLLSDNKTTLSRIDPDQNAVVAELRLPAGCNTLTFGETALWVTCPAEDRVLRIDPQNNLVDKRIEVSAQPKALAIGEGSIWVLCQKDGKVERIDPKTNKVIKTIELAVPGVEGSIAIGSGSVWVSQAGFPLTRIDPADRQGGAAVLGRGRRHGAVRQRARCGWEISPTASCGASTRSACWQLWRSNRMKRTWLPLSIFAAIAASLVLAQDPVPPAAPGAPKQRPKRPPKPGVSTPGVKREMTAIHPDTVFPIEGTPDWQVLTDDSVWVSNGPKNTVHRLNAKTNQVEAAIAVGKRPCSGLAAGFGSVWVPNCGDKTVSRIDIKTNQVVATLPIGPAESEGGIAASPDAVWLVTDAKGMLSRIDPATNKVAAEIEVAPKSAAVTLARARFGSPPPKRIC